MSNRMVYDVEYHDVEAGLWDFAGRYHRRTDAYREMQRLQRNASDGFRDRFAVIRRFAD